MGVNSLPKTVTRQRRDCDLNPGPSAPESSTLPLGYRATLYRGGRITQGTTEPTRERCVKETYPVLTVLLKANSHRYATRHDKTVLSVSHPLLRRCELDSSRQLKTVADRNMKSEHADSNCPIHTATPDTTRRVWRAV